MGFQKISEREVWSGQIASVRVAEFKHADGEIASREVVGHPGAVAIVAHDGQSLLLVRQPREAVGEPSLLELVAGKLEADEDILSTAKRELAEEIGKQAQTWQFLTSFYTSPGFTDEEVHIYLATDLSNAEATAEEEERIVVESVPLGEIDEVIGSCRDAKSLIGLMWFKLFT